MAQNNKEGYQYSKDGHNDFHSDIYIKDGVCSLCGLDVWEINGKYEQKLPIDVEIKLDDYIERINNIKWFQPSLNLKRGEIDKQIHTFLSSFDIMTEIEYRKLENINDGYNAVYEKRESSWSPMIYKTHNTAIDILKKSNLDTAFNSARTTTAKIIEDYFLDNSSKIDDVINGSFSPVVFAKKSNWGAVLGSVFNNLLDTIKDYDYKNSSDFSRRTRYATGQAKHDVSFALADLLALSSKDYEEKYPNGNFINILSVWEAGLYPIGMINGKFIVYVPAVNGEFPKQF